MSKTKEAVSTAFLRDEIVILKYINKEKNGIKDPKHVAYGGLFQGVEITIPAPTLDNKRMKNILTNEEKAGLESILRGVDLSIYGDFWKETGQSKKMGILPIRASKDEIRLNLSDPYDYIKYKVLLASPIVANSLDEIRHSASYRFVLTSTAQQLEKEKDKVGYKVMAFEAYVAHKNDKSVLRYILRNLGKYTSKGQKLDFLQVATSKEIEKDPSLFVSIAGDPLLKIKVMIEECVEAGIVNRRDGKYYDLDNNPLSEDGLPTMDNSAEYLGSNLGQEMRLALEAKLKNTKE